MKITKLVIDSIIPYENNPKEHPAYQIEQIKNSIKEFGFNDPIAVDENNVIIEGHGRLEALKELGYKEVEVIKLEHLTEEQKRAYIIAHNKINMNTGFDIEMLEKELENIDEDLLNVTGFNEIEIMELMDDITPEKFSKEDMADYEENASENVLQSHNVIICCMSEEEQEILKGLIKEDGRLKRLYKMTDIIDRIHE